MAASIAFDAAAADGTFIGAPASYTFPLTVASAAGQERVVFLGALMAVHANNDLTCTIDGVTATRIGAAALGPDDGGGGRCMITAYRAAGTANTSINVVATTVGTGYLTFGGFCGCFKLSDADTVLDTQVTLGNDPVLSVDTVTGGAAAAATLGVHDSDRTNTWSGLTAAWNTFVSSDESFGGASAVIVTGETPRAISINMPAGRTGSVASLAISFSPAAAAADTTTAESELAWQAGGGHLGHATWAARRDAYATAVGFPLAG